MDLDPTRLPLLIASLGCLCLASACASRSAAGSTASADPPPASSTIALAAIAPSALPAPTPSAPPAGSQLRAPPLDLGPGVLASDFVPGHYAGEVHRTLHATHARNRVSEEARSSFVIDLLAGGRLTACRGQRSDTRNDGPTVHRFDRLREQQGYSGHWEERDGWVQVVLDPDNDICPQERMYTNLAPKPWRLRCLLVQPRGHAVLKDPALVCQLTNRVQLDYSEEHVHAAPGVLPDRWLVLGPGNGLRVEWEAHSVNGGDEPTIRVGPSAAPVQQDTWARP